MTEVEKYLEILNKYSKEFVKSFDDKDLEILENNLGYYLGSNENKPISQSNSKREYLITLMNGFTEINDTNKKLHDIEIYIQEFPASYIKLGIEKYLYLTYHIENYLNTIYVLTNRMKVHLNIIKKQFKYDAKMKILLETTYKVIKDKIEEVFNDINDVRGEYVHRLPYSDKNIEKLSLHSTVYKFDKSYIDKFDEIYNEVSKIECNKIIENNKSINNFIEYYFGKLNITLIENGNLIFPKKLEVYT
jgi:hypothetical protein